MSTQFSFTGVHSKSFDKIMASACSALKFSGQKAQAFTNQCSIEAVASKLSLDSAMDIDPQKSALGEYFAHVLQAIGESSAIARGRAAAFAVYKQQKGKEMFGPSDLSPSLAKQLLIKTAAGVAGFAAAYAGYPDGAPVASGLTELALNMLINKPLTTGSSPVNVVPDPDTWPQRQGIRDKWKQVLKQEAQAIAAFAKSGAAQGAFDAKKALAEQDSRARSAQLQQIVEAESEAARKALIRNLALAGGAVVLVLVFGALAFRA